MAENIMIYTNRCCSKNHNLDDTCQTSKSKGDRTMGTKPSGIEIAPVVVALVIALALAGGTAWAHCDTWNGPIATTARKALETGQFETIAIFVGKKQEQELRQRFEQCLAVYKIGGHGKELAVRYFAETAVRLNRQALGIPFKGLKPAQPFTPDIAAAEKALETGQLKPVTELLSAELQEETEKWFQQAMEARKHKDESGQAARKWVDAYYKYIVYVRGMHLAIQAGPKHRMCQ
jgi:hypothetical protein